MADKFSQLCDSMERLHASGTITGPVETDARTGERSQQVIEYEHGICTDRYVTILRSAR